MGDLEGVGYSTVSAGGEFLIVGLALPLLSTLLSGGAELGPGGGGVADRVKLVQANSETALSRRLSTSRMTLGNNVAKHAIPRWPPLWPPRWSRSEGFRCAPGEPSEDILPRFMPCTLHPTRETWCLP